jgi:hypothetical protein
MKFGTAYAFLQGNPIRLAAAKIPTSLSSRVGKNLNQKNKCPSVPGQNRFSVMHLFVVSKHFF